jgi:hypothetical protein
MERAAMQEYFGKVRAFFAPVNRATEMGTVFDPAATFDLDNPASPWVDLGLVRNFKRVSKSTMGSVRTGPAGVVQVQFRKLVDARVSLNFCEWGKLQMAVAASSQHMNVLDSDGTQPRASGGIAKPGQPVLAGSTAAQILLDPSVLGNYSVNELVVVDLDHAAGITNLGTGITGDIATASTQLDGDAVRRVSYNVGCVAAITTTGLQLDAPLLGGVPANGARVQKVVGFVDREGASFLQEWSALFALEEASGGRVYFHYPRLQSAACRGDGGGASKWIEHGMAARGVRSNGLHRCERRRERSVLPVLHSGTRDTGVLIAGILQRSLSNCISVSRSGSTSVRESRISSRSHLSETLRLASESLWSGAMLRNKGRVCSAKLRPRTEICARCRLRFSSGKPSGMPRSMSRCRRRL